MQSSSAVMPSTTRRDFLGHTSGSRQMPLDLIYEDHPYEHADYKSYSPDSPNSPSSTHSGPYERQYVHTTTPYTYSPHGVPNHTSGWQPSIADLRMTRPRSTFPHMNAAPYDLPRDGHRSLPPYSGMESDSYRTTPSFSPSYSNIANAGRYAGGVLGQSTTGYSYACVDQLSSAVSTNHGHPSEPRCEWESQHCGMLLEDSSPAGIARHLRQYHSVAVTDNRNRGVCLWGGRCGKDMYPSSFGKHIAECHLRNMTKQCPHCGSDFARADTLSRHIKAFCPNTAGGRVHSSG
ncbi:hypothetical protein DICSQDRAFT_153596 [Dichomitus squalens LYAD-421 SS1]|uniref:C2H2-type domain-containing protein n=1 Tax=Dichomitus squalens TaxID=114155 RepID=A0A4Q9MLL2_9APHY|nr:uncharacterized protein DICSQDRAFT_153596 [Dichomitus squalens LYAD-421 SS1]EJF63757.1 hypothetical protein DICSQDRAFT_153596 [Dichomitus squalens LYAD-421 SS1]TBU28520.1 hypothetical protein BD311DRAFT_778268 [Dichomitus squalens]TBU59336.1 hypothetical protein BD310DRAFT_817588 [Dichomitus squalens]